MLIHRLTLISVLVWAGLCAVPTALAGPAKVGSGPPAQAARAPEASAPSLKRLLKAPVPSAPLVVAKGLSVAQLDYPVSLSASVEALFQAADDYAHYDDWDNSRLYLQRLVSAYPGTKQAGLARGLLADDLASLGDSSAAEAYRDRIREDADPEAEAFAVAMRTAFQAQRAAQKALYEQTLADYAQKWKGTLSGGRGALALGDCYRFTLEDYPQAISTYREVADNYAGTLVGEEALVALAETLNWSIPSHPEESRVVFEQALASVHYPGLQVRCLVGLADLLMRTNVESQALQMLSLVISNYPSHPAVSQAYALRATAAERQGNWELAAADARAFLAHPCPGTFNVAHAHSMVARDAFQKGDLTGAEAEYATLAALVEKDVPTAQFRGEAQAGLGACAVARGNLNGALQLYQKAADVEVSGAKKADYLFQAAGLAQQAGDLVTRARVIERMAVEVPGSHLTSMLVGRELVPAREF